MRQRRRAVTAPAPIAAHTGALTGAFTRALALALTVGAGLLAGTVGPAVAAPVGAAPAAAAGARACPPDARALGYSDGLDKLVRDGATIGGLSDLARDQRTGTWVSTVDNHDTDPGRLWSFKRLARPRVVGDPLVLTHRDGTPYTGEDGDFEGLAVLSSGRFLVSSETEPSIRVFGRHGRQRSHLRVPDRFAVAPAGQATDNATLEGLSLTPDKTRAFAAMEGTLSGDIAPVAQGGTDTYRRMLVYDRSHGRFRLTKQVGYQVDAGMRISDVAAYAPNRLLVLEASFDPATGNTIKLYAVRGIGRARDVGAIANLSQSPRAVLGKTLVADVTACPSLGAPTEETQANPLLDNYEGLAVTPVSGHHYRVTLISDDNFNDTQRTRILRLAARLP